MRTFLGFATPCVARAGLAAVQPPLHPRAARPGGGFGTADRGPGRCASAVRLPADLGPAAACGLVGEQEGGASPLAASRPESRRATGRGPAPPPARAGWQRLPPPPVARQRRCMDMGLYL